MARPREFDLDQARKDAMNVFWEQDFQGTSLPDLLDGLNLSRGSLYKAFGSKRALFLEALQLYDRSVLQPGILLLTDEIKGSGVERITVFFEMALRSVEGGDRRGCLLCNAAVSATRDDEDVGKLVLRMLDDLSRGFGDALRDTPNYREASYIEISAKADAIMLAYVGQRVMVRSGADVGRLRAANAAALSGL